MRKRTIILLVILLFFAIGFLASSLWSIIGLLVAGFGLFHYYQKRIGNKFVKRPLLIMWSGILLAFIIAIANTEVDTESANKVTDVKTSNTENIDKETKATEKAAEKERIATEAKAKEEAAEQERIAAEAKAKEEAAEQERIAAETKAKEEAAEQERIAAEAKDKEEAAEREQIAAEAKAKEEASSSNLLYDPFGSDKNCSDFPNGADAQAFYIAAGGPTSDPHDLDRDNDGSACDYN